MKVILILISEKDWYGWAVELAQGKTQERASVNTVTNFQIT
jgi:hypothetical protein